MKKRHLAYVLAAVCLAIVLFNFNYTGKTIVELNYPANCSVANISSLWNTIFQESSSGINITINGNCSSFVAYKIRNKQEVYYFSGSKPEWYIYDYFAIYMNATPGILNNIDFSNVTQRDRIFNNHSNYFQRNLSLFEADAEFKRYFKIIPENFSLDLEVNPPVFSYGNLTENYPLIGNGAWVSPNFSSIVFFYSYFGECTPNWTERNVTYTDRIVYSYTDNANCGGSRANQTIYLNPSFEGDLYLFNYHNPNWSVKIDNNAINVSVIYNGTRTISFLKNNTLFLEIDWNFSSPLNLNSIEIESSNLTDSENFLIVHRFIGNKTLYLNKVKNSNRICVADFNTFEVEDITSDCSGEDNYFLDCPGNVSNYSCSLSGSRYKIRGLKNSGVFEMESGCVAETCEEKSYGCGTFTDANCGSLVSCGSCNSGFICVNHSCIALSTPSNCTSRWNCSEWKPIDCKTGNQTRNCVDLNNCPNGNRTEVRECKVVNLGKIVLIVLLALIFISVVALIIWYFFRTDNKFGNKTYTLVNSSTEQPPNMPNNPYG